MLFSTLLTKDVLICLLVLNVIDQRQLLELKIDRVHYTTYD